MQEVEAIRRDVTVVVTQYLETPWYPKQIRDLTKPCPPGASPDDDPTRMICQRPYEPDSRAEYTVDAESVRAEGRIPIPLNAAVEPPSRGILDQLDDATIDEASQQYTAVDEAVTLRLGNVDANLEGGQYLSPGRRFGLSIMSEALGDRSIYFTSRDTASSFGVGDQIVLQGLAFNLPNGLSPSTISDGVVAIPPSAPLYALSGPYVDVSRTELLLEEVFLHRGRRSGWWPDATVTVNHFYARGYWGLAQAAVVVDDTPAIPRFVEEAQAWDALRRPAVEVSSR